MTVNIKKFLGGLAVTVFVSLLVYLVYIQLGNEPTLTSRLVIVFLVSFGLEWFPPYRKRFGY